MSEVNFSQIRRRSAKIFRQTQNNSESIDRWNVANKTQLTSSLVGGLSPTEQLRTPAKNKSVRQRHNDDVGGGDGDGGDGVDRSQSLFYFVPQEM